MKILSLCISVLFSCILISGCTENVSEEEVKQSIASLENQIRFDAEKNLPQIATTEVVYLVEYDNSTHYQISRDDYYVRVDKAWHDYGFDLNDMIQNVLVKEDGKGNRYLEVDLNKLVPKLKELQASDKSNIFSASKFDKYIPTEKDVSTGKDINVDVDKRLQNLIKEQASLKKEEILDSAKQNTESYFKMMAQHLGIELRVKKERKTENNLPS